jgi:3-hydroxyacyl-CoA dehydrogenase
MPVGPLAVLDETALSLSVHVLDQTRADLRAEGGTYIASPGELLVERMVKEFDRNGRAAGAGFYEYPEQKARRSTCGRNSRTCSSGPASVGHAGPERPLLYRRPWKPRAAFRRTC